MSTDHTPPAAYAVLIEGMLQTARDTLRENELVPPCAMLLLNGEVVDIIFAQFNDVRTKDQFAETVRQRASRFKPEAIATLTEAWGLPKEYQTREAMTAFREQYQAVSEAPFKIDILVLQLETYDGDWIGRAEVREADVGRTMGAMDWLKADHMGGRFTHFLPVRYGTPEQVEHALDVVRVVCEDAGFDVPQDILAKLRPMMAQAPAENLSDENTVRMVAHMIRAGMLHKKP